VSADAVFAQSFSVPAESGRCRGWEPTKTIIDKKKRKEKGSEPHDGRMDGRVGCTAPRRNAWAWMTHQPLRLGYEGVKVRSPEDPGILCPSCHQPRCRRFGSSRCQMPVSRACSAHCQELTQLEDVSLSNIAGRIGNAHLAVEMNSSDLAAETCSARTGLTDCSYTRDT
jgi:hypothetical protein